MASKPIHELFGPEDIIVIADAAERGDLPVTVVTGMTPEQRRNALFRNMPSGDGAASQGEILSPDDLYSLNDDDLQTIARVNQPVLSVLAKTILASRGSDEVIRLTGMTTEEKRSFLFGEAGKD